MTDPTSTDSAEQFFRRQDESSDLAFYRSPRFVTHIDDGAIAAVGELYAELGIDGASGQPRRVLDLMSSWVSHLRTPPDELVVSGSTTPSSPPTPWPAIGWSRTSTANPD
ncbi:MAG: hypothetical protein ABJA74_14335 [Lapillicoccus sp.]